MFLGLIDRYLLKEILLSWVAVTLVLVLVLTGSTLARVLGMAMDGSLPADFVFPFMLAKLIKLSSMLIPVGLYLGIIFALGRLYQDSEMAAMRACGVGHGDVFRPVLTATALAVCLITVLVVVISPWASREEQRIRYVATNRPLLSLVNPGRFTEVAVNDAVVYAQSVDPDTSQLNGVFAYNREKDGFSVETAEQASYRQAEGLDGDFIVFVNGERVTKTDTGQMMQITVFEKHGVLVPREIEASARLRHDGKTMAQLRESSDLKDRAEWHWRIAFPITAVLLALLAVPLSRTGPRQGRYGRLALAVLVYLPYSNLLVVGRKWITKGIAPEWLGLWWAHALMLIVVLYLIVRMNGPLLTQWKSLGSSSA
ncbi:MAG: LPS export ABC transporter permease LptF [Gammaproteobacteria bacterium]|nr:LPS export ABC transporter permease LptF [Gammaproteobacteria bacterium]